MICLYLPHNLITVYKNEIIFKFAYADIDVFFISDEEKVVQEEPVSESKGIYHRLYVIKDDHLNSSIVKAVVSRLDSDYIKHYLTKKVLYSSMK